MNDILINIISVLVTTVVLPLISIGGTQLIKLINSKIKNNKASKLLATATEIVINAVRSVFQTYVESLKETGKFDAQCQVTALNKAKEVALHQMTSNTAIDNNIRYLRENGYIIRVGENKNGYWEVLK